MIIDRPFPTLSPLREALLNAYRMDEATCIERLMQEATVPADLQLKIRDRARQLVMAIRNRRIGKGGIDAFLSEYDLSSQEGLALMCLAEAMLRIPDAATADKLIRDKIATANWVMHLGQSNSFAVNAVTWGFIFTGKLLGSQESDEKGLTTTLKRFVERSSAPVIRQAVRQAMKILGQEFVTGRTIEEALKRAQSYEKRGYQYSYDMLGEAARTEADAERYYRSYEHAIAMIGKASAGKGVVGGPGISIKLSALHPRYEFAQRERVLESLVPRLKALSLQSKALNIGLTIDAEEADRLDLSLDIIETVFSDPALNGWDGFGVAVQSYQKRGFFLIDWLVDLARRNKRRLVVRLIKGAYWDTEIKLTQMQSFEGYPVFTRKHATDVSYLACAKKILAAPDAIYPLFATHNAYTVAAVLEMANGREDMEFQCLHGMGYTLYDELVGKEKLNIPCRVYAPVGGHEDLLAYLVRRLLENGANSSFVNRIIDKSIPIEELIEDPIEKMRSFDKKPHPGIPLPRDLYGDARLNSRGLDLTNLHYLRELKQTMEAAVQQTWVAAPTVVDIDTLTEKSSDNSMWQSVACGINVSACRNGRRSVGCNTHPAAR